jgi:capsular polysaccharide transport system ATP-binding protein
MIRLENAHKSYRTNSGHKVVLGGVTLDIPEGQSLGVLGANGAGKSTLVRVLSGVESLERGRVVRSGEVSFPLGFSGTMHPALSGKENVRFLARLHGADERECVAWVEEFAELGEYYAMPVGTYSSGMVARLSFGACLAIEFDVYLIDEVITVGDARFRRKCLDAFEARMEHSDLVMVTHDESILRSWCDMGAVLADGDLRLYPDVDGALDAHAKRMRDSFGEKAR